MWRSELALPAAGRGSSALGAAPAAAGVGDGGMRLASAVRGVPWSAKSLGRLCITAMRCTVLPRSKSNAKRSSSGMSSSTTSASMSSDDCEQHKDKATGSQDDATRETWVGYCTSSGRLGLLAGLGGGYRAVLLEELGLAQGGRAAKLGVVVIAKHPLVTLRGRPRHQWPANRRSFSSTVTGRLLQQHCDRRETAYAPPDCACRQGKHGVLGRSGWLIVGAI